MVWSGCVDEAKTVYPFCQDTFFFESSKFSMNGPRYYENANEYGTEQLNVHVALFYEHTHSYIYIYTFTNTHSYRDTKSLHDSETMILSTQTCWMAASDTPICCQQSGEGALYKKGKV